MDPLLRQLERLRLGTSVNNLYTGCFLRADDIYTYASSISTKLNVGKCEAIVFSNNRPATCVEYSTVLMAYLCLLVRLGNVRLGY